MECFVLPSTLLEQERSAMPLSAEELRRIHAWWRAANYLSVGQIYLLDNALLKQPLSLEHIKPRLLGHWGTTPGSEFHLRASEPRDHRARPGRFAGHRPRARRPGSRGQHVAGRQLQRAVSECRAGPRGHAAPVQAVFVSRRDSQSCAPDVPGSINEGGELGYSLAHAFGAAFDNPGLIVACVIGDGEAETGPLATAWHSNKFLDPALTGPCCRFSTSTATRSPTRRCWPVFRARSWKPAARLRVGAALRRRRGARGHAQAMAATLDSVLDEIASIQRAARAASRARKVARPRWPLIVLQSPKGGRARRRWTASRSKGRGVLIRCRSRSWRPSQPTCGCWKNGCAAISRRSCSRRTARRAPCCRNWSRRVRAGWDRIRMPTAAYCCAIWPAGLPSVRGRGAAAGRDRRPRAPGCWASICATCSSSTRRRSQLPDVRAG